MTRGPAGVVFDIGGTNLRVARVASDGTIEGVRQVDSPREMVGLFPASLIMSSIVDRLVTATMSLGVSEPARVVVGFPGPIRRDGTVVVAPTLIGPASSADDLVGPIRAAFGHSDVLVANDVTCAGFHYACRFPSLTIVTVSSGIGAKVFIEGAPVGGIRSDAGEIGHYRVDWSTDAVTCDCGGNGHLGAVASGRAAERCLKQLLTTEGWPANWGRPSDDADTRTLVAAWASAIDAGDERALHVLAGLAEPLGRTLAVVGLATGVDRIVLVGGLARRCGLPYVRAVASAAAAAAWHGDGEWLGQFHLGEDADQAGLLGAAWLLTYGWETWR